MLIGRAELLRTIDTKVQDCALLILDGESGSGKTSLLQNGLSEQLEGVGFELFVLSRWPAIPQDWAIDDYLTSGLQADGVNRKDEPHLPTPDPRGIAPVRPAFFSSRLCEELDDTFDGTAVLVFDQFEEMLRQHPSDARDLMVWMKNVVETYRIRFILSLRSDSMHLLDRHLRGLPPYTVDRVTVTSFSDDEYIKAIIDSRRDDVLLPRTVVADEVSQTIRDAWKASLQPRLLGVQALMSALYFKARDKAGFDPLVPDLDKVVIIDDTTLRDVVDGSTDMFEAGLLASVAIALSHAEAVSMRRDIDRYLLHGTKELVRRATPFLWSAGFKVPALEHELVEQILEPELKLLGTPVAPLSQASDLVSSMLDSGDLLNFGAEEIHRAQTTVSSRNDATAGPLLGRGAHIALIEECRRAAFAIEWLRATGIAKRTEDHTLTLIHDGSGVALRAWAQQNRPGIEYEVHRLTSARGEHFDFGTVGRQDNVGWSLDGSQYGARVLPNLNWRDCRITGDFKRTVFLNCDFSGASFVGSSFEGATFVNCLLDDATLESCVFIGKPDIVPQPRVHDPAKVRIAPSFEIPVAAGMAAAFSAYLPLYTDDPAATARFFSDLAGTPAVPGGRPRDHVGELVEFQAANGGVALVGGRISFLTLHSCGNLPGSETEGAAEFHYVAGGGLDIVEPIAASITLHDCAVRGVSVTRDEKESDHMFSDQRHIRFRANDSFLVYVYFAGALKGSAEFTESTLWGVMNAAGARAEDGEPPFTVTIKECRHQFVVNAHAIVDSTEDTKAQMPPPYFEKRRGDDSVFDARGPSDLATQLEFMDYRREPEVRELHQRRMWAEGSVSDAVEG